MLESKLYYIKQKNVSLMQKRSENGYIVLEVLIFILI